MAKYSSILSREPEVGAAANAQQHFHNGSERVAIQKKSSAATVNDPMEGEADAVADEVMQMPEQPFVQRKCAHCSEESMQRKPLTSFIQQKGAEESEAVTEAAARRIQSSKGKGMPLNESAGSFMESRFGTRFNDVRIHTGSDAEQMSEQLHANAFTTGNDIYFNAGKYAPETESGKHLLAHELTHTLQQGGEAVAVQKEEKDKTYTEKPEIDYKILPPEFQLRLFHFLVKADTSKVQLDFTAKNFMTGLSYDYGSALSLNMRFRDFLSKLGWEPGSNKLSLGMKYGGFSGNLSANPGEQKYGLGLQYGVPLLPFQSQMSSTFMAGGNALTQMAGGLPGAINDPLGFYKQNESNIDDISKTVDLVKQITEDGKNKIRFGANFSLSYDPQNQWLFTAAAGGRF